MEIRVFTETDTESVVDLWTRCGLVVPQNGPRRDIARKRTEHPELFLVGVEGGRVVAAVMGGYEGHRGWLNYVAVDPAVRRRGLGRRIVVEVERRLRSLGCAKVNLQVRRSNTEVVEFYRRLGYVVDDVLGMGKRFDDDSEGAGPGIAGHTPVLSPLGQPVGWPVEPIQARRPPRAVMRGRWCTVAPLEPERHGRALWSAYAADTQGRAWTYLAYGPFPAPDAFQAWLLDAASGDDPLFHVILDAVGTPVGLASYLRMQPEIGVIEVGHLNFSPALQRTPAATEAMYLMARRVFRELGYRRYEWKCDSLNAPSRRAASRLGFRYEGLFRQATVYKGRNRDTAWYSITDGEWPALERAFERWLDPSNFDESGAQRRSLAGFRV